MSDPSVHATTQVEYSLTYITLILDEVSLRCPIPRALVISILLIVFSLSKMLNVPVYVWKPFLGGTDFKRLMISISDLLHLSSGDKKRFSLFICLSMIASSTVKHCTKHCTKHCINCLCLLSKSRVDSRDLILNQTLTLGMLHPAYLKN